MFTQPAESGAAHTKILLFGLKTIASGVMKGFEIDSVRRRDDAIAASGIW